MPFGKAKEQLIVALLTAILLAIGGLIWTSVNSHASEEDLKTEAVERKEADKELKVAQTELAKAVTEHIRVDDIRGARVDIMLDTLEKYIEKNGG